MSETKQTNEEDLREKISMYLKRNFPQINMHGGEASIRYVDKEEGEVGVKLGGACSGCGISPMTIQALKNRMPQDIDEIDTVTAGTGYGGSVDSSGFNRSRGEMKDEPEAPF